MALVIWLWTLCQCMWVPNGQAGGVQSRSLGGGGGGGGGGGKGVGGPKFLG